ncbi:MAG: ATP-binding protein [Sciscionella sp.]
MRRRILLAILLAIAVTACALGIPLGYTALTEVESLTRAELATRAQSIATILDEQIARSHRPDLVLLRAGIPRNGAIVLVTPQFGKQAFGTLPEDAVTEQVPTLNSGTVAVSEPAGPMHTRQAQVAVFLLLLVVLSVGSGTLVATTTARRLAKPLRFVADRAARLGAGDFRADPTRYAVPELDMVVQTLDSSAAALAGLVQRERDLVGDVSHQLRSRLTALQLRLEGLAEHPDAEVVEEATAAMEQADRLNGVLAELLDASRRARALDAEPIDLSAQLAMIARDWREQLRSQGRSLRITAPEHLCAMATPARLQEAIGVLLDNAVKHGGDGVVLAARTGESVAVIEVRDHGPGVPDGLAAHVFERGVSGHGSTGVGLALARALVDADGGRLELSVARPATFTLFLPMPSPEQIVGGPWRTGPR